MATQEEKGDNFYPKRTQYMKINKSWKEERDREGDTGGRLVGSGRQEAQKHNNEERDRVSEQTREEKMRLVYFLISEAITQVQHL